MISATGTWTFLKSQAAIGRAAAISVLIFLVAHVKRFFRATCGYDLSHASATIFCGGRRDSIGCRHDGDTVFKSRDTPYA